MPNAIQRSNAVLYLARGATSEDFECFHRFAESYRRFPAGVAHKLFVIFKGYESAEHLQRGRRVFAGLEHHALFTSDDSFDIGAYRDVIHEVAQDNLCLLNTHSEIACDNWLAKLVVNLSQPFVGIVGATASFQSLFEVDSPTFPNAHIRSNAFMMRRRLFSDSLANRTFTEKKDAWDAESGKGGFTRRVFELGMTALLVGRDGRGYPPHFWPLSDTYRLGAQTNLLVHDNLTRAFEHAPMAEKRRLHDLSWGNSKHADRLFLLPLTIPVLTTSLAH